MDILDIDNATANRYLNVTHICEENAIKITIQVAWDSGESILISKADACLLAAQLLRYATD